MNWSGKTVLITGASSGIGEALAVELGRRGAAVGLLARREDVLRVVAAKVEAAGGRALSAYSRDHLLVKQGDLGRALRALGEHVAELC